MALGQLCYSFVPTSTSRFSSYKVKHSTPTLFSHRDRNSLGMEQSCTAFGAGPHNWHVCTTRLALVSQLPFPAAVRQLDEAKFLQLRSWRRRLTSKWAPTRFRAEPSSHWWLFAEARPDGNIRCSAWTCSAAAMEGGGAHFMAVR